ncbi:DUF2304 domain-containing protein [Marinihelvus fidelis]|uniref:DUF2304 domain-containing protein n=1 Tax=Marinihelvus fidelis TaxID=2613842 RepID=A0A5N0TGV8_9GAMM|nr:DUF2304 domain-containing protein [Marinihelvus fidelis]KAA9133367.1 DUF2304 domain-containing protein [Marinihelvus fidelis]
MFSWVSGAIGLAAAISIILLIRRDHLHVRFGIWWITVAAVFVVLGFYPGAVDRLASFLGIASGPVLALTIGLTVFVIKILTIDIASSRNETRIVRLVQRVAMLESEIDRLKRESRPEGAEVVKQASRDE